ncbi:MAG: TetR/AcrR family transcriptional regulator [Thermoanaerobaculia bacterium]
MHAKQKSKEEVVEEFRVSSITEAAMRVIARKGLAGATMQEVAHEAGVAKGTLYLYFSDREDLFEKTSEYACTYLTGQADEALRSEGSFADRLRALVRSQLEAFDRNQEFFRAFVAMAEQRQPSRSSHSRNTVQKMQTTRMSEFFAGAIAAGELRDVDPGRLAVFFVEGLKGVILRRLEDRTRTPIDDDVDLVTSLFLEGTSRKGKKG